MSEMTIEKARAIFDGEEMECKECYSFMECSEMGVCDGDGDCTHIVRVAGRIVIEHQNKRIADLEQREKELATGLMTNCENCVTRLENGEWVCARCPTRKYRDKAAETLRKFGGE